MVREKVRKRVFRAAQRFLMVAGAATATAVFCAVTLGALSPAAALPSFARQTGQPCGTCHTDFPGLTPYGRKFKLLGYTTGGGPYRTAPFREFPRFKKDPLDSYVNADDAQSNARKKSDLGKEGQSTPGQSDTWVPPISMMAIVGYTHTQAPQDATGSPYKSNGNLVVAPVSVFYGGAVTEHIGAFAQLTWNNAPFGAPDQADPYATRQVTWDNADIRYSNTAKLGNTNVIYGITANNNPTVQDLWNTTPAWAFPYNVSNIAASGPTSSTLIEGALAARVAGVGAYAWINDLLYLELTGYRAINFDSLLKLGPDPFQGPGVSPGKMVGIAPYWRVAMEPHWGNHWLEFGAFGMSAQVNPFTTVTDANGFYLNQTFQETDRYTDIGFDTQYQYQGPNYWITLRGTYIHEKQTLDASSLNFGTNPTNTLDTFKALASFAYGNDNRVVLTGQYFNSQGTSDATLYASNPGFSPNSDGYILEVAYIPFISSQAPVWPWANARVGLQYTYYNKFNGDTVSAHDNNSLFAYIWFAM
jgi:hypothetical protein